MEKKCKCAEDIEEFSREVRFLWALLSDLEEALIRFDRLFPASKIQFDALRSIIDRRLQLERDGGRSDPPKDHALFLSELRALLNRWGATMGARDHWEGFAECGENVRITVEFDRDPDINLPDLDLGRDYSPGG